MTVFNWAEYQDLASELANANNVAKKRSSISRAYYASFMSCKNFLLGRKLFLGRKSKVIMENKSSEVYKEVYKIFREFHYKYNRGDSDFHQKNLIGKKISGRLSDLRKSRNRADYEDEFEKLDDYTEYSIIQSEEVLGMLNSFNP